MLRALTAGIAGAAVLAVGAAGAMGVDARASLERLGGPPVAGKQFRVIAAVESKLTSPPFDYRLTVTLSAGLRLVKVSEAFNPVDCSTSGQVLTCRGHSIGSDVGTHTYRVDLVSSAGAHTISSSISIVDGEDVNPGDNTASLDVVVGQAPFVATGLVLTPTKPAAGKTLRATLLLKRAGVPVRATRVLCVAKIGGAALKGRGAPTPAGGACTWALPRSAKGKRITGSVSATVGATKLAKAFSKLVA